MLAIKNGAKERIDTDDDNFPFIEKWQELLKNDFNKYNFVKTAILPLRTSTHIFQMHRHFIWPRGFPLDLIQKSTLFLMRITQPKVSQKLVFGSAWLTVGT